MSRLLSSATILPLGAISRGKLASEMPYAATDLEPELAGPSREELSEASSLCDDLGARIDPV